MDTYGWRGLYISYNTFLVPGPVLFGLATMIIVYLFCLLRLPRACSTTV